MARDGGELRGRAMVRPLRVGQLIDPTATDEVREAIANLTKAWGGIFAPILDIRHSFDSLDRIARSFDVDALHTEMVVGEVVDRLRGAGWLWRGRADFGPFAVSEGGFRNGVLPVCALAVDHPHLVTPHWRRDDSLEFFYSVVFGTTGPTAVAAEVESYEGSAGTSVEIDDLLNLPDIALHQVGAIRATEVGINIRSDTDRAPDEVFVIRANHGEDAVDFWNLRACGARVIPVPADAPQELVSSLMRGLLSAPKPGEPAGGQWRPPRLLVWGLEHASADTRHAVQARAESLGWSISSSQHEADVRLAFPGLESAFIASVRGDFAPRARSVTMSVPTIPLRPGEHQVMPGVVAVEIDMVDVRGLDPRLAAVPPPDRRCGRILNGIVADAAGVVRVNREGDGFVLGIQARRDEVTVGFASHLDVLQAYFDDADMKILQSDEGAFQTRAAEMLGGPFAGVALQPGVRAALAKAARTSAGLTLPQLKSEIANNRGDWPDKLRAFHTSPEEYVEGTVRGLLNSGMFVPLLDVHCSNCRVDSQITPRDLDTTLRCEFCGDDFLLALSLALSKSKSRWRYRLASHLSPEKVKALLPALATMSVIGNAPVWAPAASVHAFGVEFAIGGIERLEADIVAYLGRPDWTLALGEVKNSNWIDAKDVVNLEKLQQRLDQKRIRTILIFSTLKASLAPQEIVVLRALTERVTTVTTAFGAAVPRFPLILTGPDLSLPWMDDKHPWRWGRPEDPAGIYRTAAESCKRNLGLVDFSPTSSDPVRAYRMTWNELPQEAHG